MPWRDENHESYHKSRRPGRHHCLGCRKPVPYSAWGPWCHPCNVTRMRRINKGMAQLARSIGDEAQARELERE
jgi:hypothetical protein